MTNYKYKEDQGLKRKNLKVRDPSQSFNGDHAETIHFTPSLLWFICQTGRVTMFGGRGRHAKQIARSKTPNASKAVKLIRTRIWESRKSTSLGSVAQGFLSTPTLTNHQETTLSSYLRNQIRSEPQRLEHRDQAI